MLEIITNYVRSYPAVCGYVLGGLAAIYLMVWVWSACRLASRSIPKPARRRDWPRF
jgi:hypothetical protein